MKSLSRVGLLATLWTAAYQAPPSMGFSRQEYWSGVPLPSSSYYVMLKFIKKHLGGFVINMFHFYALEKEMATHSSVLAWRIPGMGNPGGLPFMGRTESDTTEAT